MYYLCYKIIFLIKYSKANMLVEEIITYLYWKKKYLLVYNEILKIYMLGSWQFISHSQSDRKLFLKSNFSKLFFIRVIDLFSFLNANAIIIGDNKC